MKNRIVQLIETCIEETSGKKAVSTTWKSPIVGFADARDPLFEELKHLVRPSHALPLDLLEGARTVIAYFIPFGPAVVKSNRAGGHSSDGWALAYLETNRLLARINERVSDLIEAEGYRSTRLPITHNFDEETLLSDWSHRHAAYIAGIGSFGRHHLLITDKGCAGRLGSLVTDATIPPTSRIENERCLFKRDGSCEECVKRCPVEALSQASFRRNTCYGRLLENARLHERHGFADVCGKCATAVPCAFTTPVRRTRSR
jgi:epoxyqueuosine reductase QueG